MSVFHPFLKIFLVLSPFCWIRIRIVFAWIRIRIKVHPGSGSVAKFFTSWIDPDPDPDPYQNDRDPPHCGPVPVIIGGGRHILRSKLLNFIILM